MKDIQSYLEQPQVETMLEAAHTTNKRDYLLMKVLWQTGIRVDELLYVTALWLVNKSGGPDYAVPVEPVPPPLVPNKLIPFEDLLELLQEKAKSSAAQRDDTLGGGV